jgi:ABC-type multidrug transport system ATPase subunit
MIEMTGVEKVFGAGPLLPRGGGVRALVDVTLRVRAGEAVGLIGVNGAGKSTLLKILLGYVRPTAGEVEVGGLTPRRYAESHGVAYVPERVAIPPWWTVRGALTAYAMLGELGDDAHERVEAAMGRLGLLPLATRRVGRLSKGNVQRLALAQAILGNRSLMVLDEPTDGLDPLWIAELREIVHEWRAADPSRTLVVASHNLAEVERLADRVLVLHDGVLRDEITIDAASRGTLEAHFLDRVRDWGGGR